MGELALEDQQADDRRAARAQAQAFVEVYIRCSCSCARTADELGQPLSYVRAMLATDAVRNALNVAAAQCAAGAGATLGRVIGELFRRMTETDDDRLAIELAQTIAVMLDTQNQRQLQGQSGSDGGQAQVAINYLMYEEEQTREIDGGA